MTIAHADLSDARSATSVPKVVPIVAGYQGYRAQSSIDWPGLAGIGLASLLPAAFWTAAIWLIAAACGVQVASATLAAIAMSIALFLAVVCTAVMANR